MQRSALFLLVVILISAPCCFGGIITLPATLRGSVNPEGLWASGGSGTSTGNYLTGDTGWEQRSAFVFNLTSVVGTVTAASLQLTAETGSGYVSLDPTETFAIFDYLLDPAALGAGNPGVAAYTDLGAGTTYGGKTPSNADEGGLVGFDLNASGLAAINAAMNGKFALGGALTTLSGSGGDEFVFGSTIHTVAQLVLTTADQAVQEPVSILLTGTGIAFLIWCRRAA